ncbi:hypothetical protein SSUST1_1721 [Streptococcus suis ST1]|nr:hypothetical protein SSUST1_1721 [Streptococcus suis ST1]
MKTSFPSLPSFLRKFKEVWNSKGTTLVFCYRFHYNKN